MNEGCEDSANLLPESQHIQQKSKFYQADQSQHLIVDDEDFDNSSAQMQSDSQNEIDKIHSQSGVQQSRFETYKNILSSREKDSRLEKDDVNDILSIYRKKKARIISFPAIFHVITKTDLLSEKGLEDQMSRTKTLQNENIIDQFFFTSSKDTQGTSSFLNAINERRIDSIREQQE